jgi:hypothetical protein
MTQRKKWKKCTIRTLTSYSPKCGLQTSKGTSTFFQEVHEIKAVFTIILGTLFPFFFSTGSIFVLMIQKPIGKTSGT